MPFPFRDTSPLKMALILQTPYNEEWARLYAGSYESLIRRVLSSAWLRDSPGLMLRSASDLTDIRSSKNEGFMFGPADPVLMRMAWKLITALEDADTLTLKDAMERNNGFMTPEKPMTFLHHQVGGDRPVTRVWALPIENSERPLIVVTDDNDNAVVMYQSNGILYGRKELYFTRICSRNERGQRTSDVVDWLSAPIPANTIDEHDDRLIRLDDIAIPPSMELKFPYSKSLDICFMGVGPVTSTDQDFNSQYADCGFAQSPIGEWDYFMLGLEGLYDAMIATRQLAGHAPSTLEGLAGDIESLKHYAGISRRTTEYYGGSYLANLENFDAPEKANGYFDALAALAPEYPLQTMKQDYVDYSIYRHLASYNLYDIRIVMECRAFGGIYTCSYAYLSEDNGAWEACYPYGDDITACSTAFASAHGSFLICMMQMRTTGFFRTWKEGVQGERLPAESADMLQSDDFDQFASLSDMALGEVRSIAVGPANIFVELLAVAGVFSTWVPQEAPTTIDAVFVTRGLLIMDEFLTLPEAAMSMTKLRHKRHCPDAESY